MTSKITINIETDDATLAGRIADAFCGPQHVVKQAREVYAPGVTADDMELVDTRTADTLQTGTNDEPAHRVGEADAFSEQTPNALNAEGTATGTTSGQGGLPAGAGTDAPRDQRGVAFNVHYCGEAQEPFYASGKRSGQWKKKRGVSDKDYDDWYAEELAELSDQERQPEPVNSAAAFGSPQHQNQQPAAPQDTGEFMGWVAEKQAAGLITQDDIQKAYGQVGVQVADLFPPNDHAAIAGAIAGLYGVLSQKAGA